MPFAVPGSNSNLVSHRSSSAEVYGALQALFQARHDESEVLIGEGHIVAKSLVEALEVLNAGELRRRVNS